jgi:hypothetical protein
MKAYDPTWIKVYYGTAKLPATYSVDYTVTLAIDYESFTVTPTASLVTKLNNLGQGNGISVVRIIPGTTDFAVGDAFVREKIVEEFDKCAMRAAQVSWSLGLIPESFITDLQAALEAVELALGAVEAAELAATNAAASQAAASGSAATASAEASTATTKAGEASTSAAAAAASQSAAAGSATTASTQAGNASTSATAAAGSASAAAGSASAAATSQTNAGNSATAAAASALAASTAIGALAYLFSTTTTNADPGSGLLRLNNATPASATAMYIDNNDSNAIDVTGLLDAVDDSTNTIRAVMTIRAQADPTIRRVYNVTGSVVDSTGYRTLTIAHVSGSGTLTNNMPVWVIFQRSGDKGADGAGSGDVVGPASATDGYVAMFDTGTGKLLKNSNGNAPLVPTASAGTNTTQAASTAFVKAAIDVVLGGVSASFDTLSEIVAAMVTLTGSQTLTNKTLTSPAINTPTLTDPVMVGAIAEDIYTISDGAAFEIDPGNGTIQFITLGANRTPKATNFANGESITMHIADGTNYTLTWTDSTFGGSGVVWIGGAAPTLATSGYSVVVLWKAGNQVYGKYIGDHA